MKFPISFIKDDKLVLNVDSVNFKTICPRVVKFNEGFYRMYFSQQKKSSCADSRSESTLAIDPFKSDPKKMTDVASLREAAY